MLVAARGRFLEESYDNVSLREIASDAGVDVSLVSRYFGSKEDLFREVLSSGKKKLEPTSPVDLPSFLADAILEHDSGDSAGAHADTLLIILRSASSPHASEIVRKAIRDELLDPVAKLLNGLDCGVRASLCVALIMGIKLQRTIMGVGALSDCDPANFRRRLVSMLKVALKQD